MGHWLVAPKNKGDLGIFFLCPATGGGAELSINHGGCAGFLYKGESTWRYQCPGIGCGEVFTNRYGVVLKLEPYVNAAMIRRWAAEWLNIDDSLIEVNIEWKEE